MGETVLVMVDDLFFLSKIQQAAKLVGVRTETVTPQKVQGRLAQGPVRAIVMDLNHRSGLAVEAVKIIKTLSGEHSPRVLGFLSHVQVDLAVAAREAGCDVVMPRSAFSQKLGQLLRELAGQSSDS